MKNLVLTFSLVILTFFASAQNPFNYKIELEPIAIPGFPGLHSYAFAQHDGKWLLIGGRRDGLHARNPFDSFSVTYNNTDIIVVDPASKQTWKVSVNTLPTAVREQLQSTNMNFFQHNDTLIIIGGYGFSATANNHKTHPAITSIIVSSTISSIINNQGISTFIKSTPDERMAITGGQLGKIGEEYYLVGGHRFDGRYNSMNNPTFTQTYATEYKKFRINNSGSQLTISGYKVISDPVHLRRRDYNLVPQIFPDGSEGYMISSGVFQANVDLPFLYPVDINSEGYTPQTQFNQYLSHYHSPKAALYDASNKLMFSLFFGGLSQYYYQNGVMIKDDAVPFVRTISMVVRDAENKLTEYKTDVEMPGLKGTGAEFIPDKNLAHTDSEIILLNDIQPDSFIIGYLCGGINSPSLNPFTANQTATTSADQTIYLVKLIKNQPSALIAMPGENPYRIKLFPNPASSHFYVEFTINEPGDVQYFITNQAGKMISDGKINVHKSGLNKYQFSLNNNFAGQHLLLTLVFENKFFVTGKVLFVEH